MITVTNSFSINMLPDGVFYRVSFTNRSAEWVKARLKNHEWQSAVGHKFTANLLSNILGTDIPFDRTSITLDAESQLIVAQYTGPRLDEGVVVLPEGAAIKFWDVRIIK